MAGFSLAIRPGAGHHDPVHRTASVVIVDDHASFRRTARRILEEAAFDVVGEASEGAEALAVIGELRPDVVLLDVQLPDRDGFQVAAELCRWSIPPIVVLVSSRSRSDYGSLIDRSGARGFLNKAELSGAAVWAVVGADDAMA